MIQDIKDLIYPKTTEELQEELTELKQQMEEQKKRVALIDEINSAKKIIARLKSR